jgi:hypothetical protein
MRLKIAWKENSMAPDHSRETDFPVGIGMPATRALTVAGYTRLEQLMSVTEKELVKLHGMGPKALGMLRSALEARGLRFADAKGRQV